MFPYETSGLSCIFVDILDVAAACMGYGIQHLMRMAHTFVQVLSQEVHVSQCLSRGVLFRCCIVLPL